jgi:hypothetical protein
LVGRSRAFGRTRRWRAHCRAVVEAMRRSIDDPIAAPASPGASAALRGAETIAAPLDHPRS